MLRYLADVPLGDDRAHYVRDYRRLVQKLIVRYSIDEAMSIAVGGSYAEMGAKLVSVLAECGLENGDRLLDLGCGSGRLASALAGRFDVAYLGLDIVPELLDYARTRAPASYRFELNTDLAIPAADGVFDFVCAFSLLTHLQHEESYLYLADLARVLRPSGTLVFSFLEFAEATHWPTFATTAKQAAEGKRTHLNVFIERSVIELWSARLGFTIERIIGPGESAAAGDLGQSVAVLRRA